MYIRRLLLLGASFVFIASAGQAPANPAIALPRIGIRTSGDRAEFYNRATGNRFVPGGFTYTILSQIANRSSFANATFDPGLYDPNAIDAALVSMHNNGFNLIRVILDSGDRARASRGQYGIAGPFDGRGLYRPFISNFIDFLKRARAHDMYALVSLHAYPDNRGFLGILESGVIPGVGGTNQYYLSPGGIRAKSAYVTELLDEVRSVDNGSLLSTVFAWDIQSEIFLTDASEPFSLHAGTVATADGKSYEMGDAASRQACMDSNLINWADQISQAIHSRDPDALVTAGFATYDAVHKTGPNGLLGPSASDPRYPPRPLVFERARALSFINVHAYPKAKHYSLVRDLDSIEFDSWNFRDMPFLLGEFGANKRAFRTIDSAVSISRQQQETALRMGLSGTVFWTWNTLQQQNKWWSAVEADEAIAKALLKPR